MPFEIGFSRSSKTGRPKAMLEGVVRAVERVGATIDLKTQDVTLSNGERFHLAIDPGERQMLIVADAMSLELSAFVYALADETAMILQAMDVVAVTPSGGEPPMLMGATLKVKRLTCEEDLHRPLHVAFEIDKFDDDEADQRQAAFEKALADRRAALAAGDTRPRPTAHGGGSRPSLFQRLSDALFGKAI